MITSYILITLLFLLLVILGFTVFSKTNSDAIGIPSLIIAILSSAAFIVFGVSAGVGGEWGYNTYKEYSTTEFTKALATDHSNVTIVYKNKPYVWKDYSVVHNFHSITNILIYDRISVLGNPIEAGMKIVTPKNVDDALLDNAEN